jgi:hypothetical protein
MCTSALNTDRHVWHWWHKITKILFNVSSSKCVNILVGKYTLTLMHNSVINVFDY